MSRPVRLGTFVALGLLLAAGLALLVSPHASSEPDGLERVAIDEGFAADAQPHQLEDLPTAGYAVEAVQDDGLSTGLAGIVGIAATFALTGGILLAARRRAPAATTPGG